MDINKPIFLTGMVRSGTTILHHIFTKHKDLAYFEHYAEKFQRFPFLLPVLFKYRKIKYGIDRPEPTTGSVWEINPTNSPNLIKWEMKSFGTNRFANLNQGHYTRIKLLNKLFPDAFFIVVWRDHKAVISSLKKEIQDYNKLHNDATGWDGIIRNFITDSELLQICFKHYNFVTSKLKSELELYQKRVFNIQYADLVKEPRKIIKKAYEFVNLDWYDEIPIPQKLIQGNDLKWLSLPTKQIQMIQQFDVSVSKN